MAALGTATVVVNERRIASTNKKRRNRVTITFGDGVSTYPANGIPLPAASGFGMTRQLDYVTLVDPSSPDGFVYKYSVALNTIRIYAETTVAVNAPLLEATAAFAPAATTLVGEAVGW
jgi:hypothetical protein